MIVRWEMEDERMVKKGMGEIQARRLVIFDRMSHEANLPTASSYSLPDGPVQYHHAQAVSLTTCERGMAKSQYVRIRRCSGVGLDVQPPSTNISAGSLQIVNTGTSYKVLLRLIVAICYTTDTRIPIAPLAPSTHIIPARKEEKRTQKNKSESQ